MFKALTTAAILFSAGFISLSAHANPSTTSMAAASPSYQAAQSERPKMRIVRQKIEPKIVQKASTNSERAVFYDYNSTAKTKVVTKSQAVKLSTPNHFNK